MLTYGTDLAWVRLSFSPSSLLPDLCGGLVCAAHRMGMRPWQCWRPWPRTRPGVGTPVLSLSLSAFPSVAAAPPSCFCPTPYTIPTRSLRLCPYSLYIRTHVQAVAPARVGVCHVCVVFPDGGGCSVGVVQFAHGPTRHLTRAARHPRRYVGRRSAARIGQGHAWIVRVERRCL
jgi:hypothetical protein